LFWARIAVPVPPPVLKMLLKIFVSTGLAVLALLLAFCESTTTDTNPAVPALGVNVLPLTVTPPAPPTSTPDTV
jgi:hypothetical protein